MKTGTAIIKAAEGLHARPAGEFVKLVKSLAPSKVTIGNEVKTVNAARRQIEDIEYIEKTKGLKYLSASLRELAELRLEEPDANLTELGEMLNPPVSKSGVNHRLRKISNYANEVREKEENKF